MQKRMILIYPDRRSVSPETIIGWYQDAVANDEIFPEDASSESVTLETAIRELEDAGLITVDRRSVILP